MLLSFSIAMAMASCGGIELQCTVQQRRNCKGKDILLIRWDGAVGFVVLGLGCFLDELGHLLKAFLEE